MNLIKIEIHSEWRSGTGRGKGLYLDAETLRDALGLPMLPGRQIKGLVRHALESGAEWAGDWNHDLVQKLCGINSQSEEKSRFETEAGKLSFSSARMGQEWLNYFTALKDQDDQSQADAQKLIEALYKVRRQTAMDDQGLVKDHSLRSIEVCVPMTLYATVQGDLNEEETQALSTALKLIRSVGGMTTRGLGRASLSLVKGEG